MATPNEEAARAVLLALFEMKLPGGEAAAGRAAVLGYGLLGHTGLDPALVNDAVDLLESRKLVKANRLVSGVTSDGWRFRSLLPTPEGQRKYESIKREENLDARKVIHGPNSAANKAQELVAKLRALTSAADTHLKDPRAIYFDPPHISDLFTRAAGVMEALRAKFSSAFGDLPVRPLPTSSGTTDYEGRGYIHRDQIETLRRDLRYCVDVLDALPPDVVNPPAGARLKDQKFGILDAPTLLEDDLPESLGLLGVALIYLDIDHFKKLNTKYTERVVDKTVLPEFQKLIADATVGHGYAYAEGGDEVVILLLNFSLGMATAFVSDLHEHIRKAVFVVETSKESVTVSAGLAVGSAVADLPLLANRANEAKRDAKGQGRDRVVVWRPPSGSGE